MPENPYLLSIAGPDPFSVGAFLTNCTTLWDPNIENTPHSTTVDRHPVLRLLFDAIAANDPGSVYWDTPCHGLLIRHMVFADEGIGIVDWPPPAQKRMACHLLIDSMPDSGLDECGATLFEYYSHYSTLKPTKRCLSMSREIADFEYVGVEEAAPLYIPEE